jgi:ribosomal protein S18 acetylase RimI-like enzyme
MIANGSVVDHGEGYADADAPEDIRGDISTQPRIALRPATVEDGSYSFGLYQDLLRPYFESTLGWDQRFRSAAFRVSYPLEALEIIGFDGQERAGVLCLLPSVDRSIEVALLLVEPALQGLGIGTRVLARVCSNALRADRAVRLSTFRLNQSAVRLYLRLGFAVIAEDEHYLHFSKDPLALPE